MLFIGDSQATRASDYKPQPTIWAFKGKKSQFIFNAVKEKDFKPFHSIFLTMGTVNCLNNEDPSNTSQSIIELLKIIRENNPAAKVIVLGLPNMNCQGANPASVLNFNKTIKKIVINLRDKKLMFFTTTNAKIETEGYWKKLHFDRQSLNKIIHNALETYEKYQA
jgi:hypothetical protein